MSRCRSLASACLMLVACGSDPSMSAGDAGTGPPPTWQLDEGRDGADAATPPAVPSAQPDAAVATAQDAGATSPLPPPCPAGQKRCGGLCTAPHPVVGCDLEACEPCPGLSRGGVVCEGGACSEPATASMEDIPLDEGCPDAMDPATVLPDVPITAAVCGDPRTTDPTTLPQGCCFYGCFRGHHYYSCRPPTGFGDFHDVQAACRAVGMKLAQIDDHYENEFVSRWGGQHGINALTIGLTTMDDPDVWRWSTEVDDLGPILYDNGVLREGAYSALWPSTHGGMPFPCTDCYVRVSGYGWSGNASITFADPFVCESPD